jgi:hypothetical protein
VTVFIGPCPGGATAAFAETSTGPMPTSAMTLRVGPLRQPLIVLVVASVIVIVVAPGETFPVCVEVSVIVSAVQDSPSPSQSVTPTAAVTVNPSFCSASAGSAGALFIKLPSLVVTKPKTVANSDNQETACFIFACL